MPPMGKRSSFQVSMVLPSTLTVKLSPSTRVLTVIADRGLPGSRFGAVMGACAAPPTTAQRLNSSSPPGTAVSVQRRYSSSPAARTTQLTLHGGGAGGRGPRARRRPAHAPLRPLRPPLVGPLPELRPKFFFFLARID